MSLRSLTGRVALVTGAASGIGAATVAALRDNGVRVAACDIAPDADDKDGFALDVTDAEAVETVVAEVSSQLGEIDILVNVAGILRTGTLLDTTAKDWNDTFAVNSTGVFLVTKAVTTRMVRRGSGSVVTVASNAGGVPRVGMGAYPASKAAAAHLTRCFGLELAEHGIRCNIVAPGSTDTPMFRSMWTTGDGAAAAVAGDPGKHRLGIPLRKIASAEEVARVVTFLASDDASHLTMQELYVDGGASLR
ncbi:2,3-dihydro-2,3-dihydroxybenzoate dehydrogenase [Stackebrandtia nassauensis]|uniref:2,3-dihydro-2,3-dihydroxybenzoate dehydrogenase n=1 Tax=Stackebrandtia nassauensis (strain DSM 44728 / CIP 108903 / NRRL B-16338 / NBRC 102104 / LLR-40K-21) TaxID=446470 RepID=D3Q5B0_STANL|nr:2,3-dihydro-2,3-dihydroxybenzoate dehydrogenase [Stackebrandtia nassauensis]ADD44159.1 short-chain dehydrogenase/reductase SDR [Stackebrandtia nassauensis DSM 44728]